MRLHFLSFLGIADSSKPPIAGSKVIVGQEFVESVQEDYQPLRRVTIP